MLCQSGKILPNLCIRFASDQNTREIVTIITYLVGMRYDGNKDGWNMTHQFKGHDRVINRVAEF